MRYLNTKLPLSFNTVVLMILKGEERSPGLGTSVKDYGSKIPSIARVCVYYALNGVSNCALRKSRILHVLQVLQMMSVLPRLSFIGWYSGENFI